jgi:hypothetical protein
MPQASKVRQIKKQPKKFVWQIKNQNLIKEKITEKIAKKNIKTIEEVTTKKS